MKAEYIRSMKVYHTGYARDCERVENHGKCGPNTWSIVPCGREANFEREIIDVEGFRVISALCQDHAQADIDKWIALRNS